MSASPRHRRWPRAQRRRRPARAPRRRPGSPELLQRVPAILYTADAGRRRAAGTTSAPRSRRSSASRPRSGAPTRPVGAAAAPRRPRAGARRRGRRVDGRRPRRAPPSTGCCTATAAWSGSATTPCCWSATTARAAGTACMSDITEPKRAEAELERRAAQQAAVARLGEHALEGASTSDLMQEAVSAAAELLGVEIAAVIELLPERRRVRVPRRHAACPTGRAVDGPGGPRLPGRLHDPQRGARSIVADWRARDALRALARR